MCLVLVTLNVMDGVTLDVDLGGLGTVDLGWAVLVEWVLLGVLEGLEQGLLDSLEGVLGDLVVEGDSATHESDVVLETLLDEDVWVHLGGSEVDEDEIRVGWGL